MKNFKRISASVLAGVIAFLAVFLNLLSTVDKASEDLLYHHATGTTGEIRIIKIDDKTMNKLGDISTWDRSVYTKLLNTLYVSDEIRPAVVGFDILLSSEKDSVTDKLKLMLKTQHAIVIKNNQSILQSEFDKIILGYAQAIHINETVNPDDKATIGMLWLNLHWACKDAGDIKLATHCARNAIKKLRSVIDDDLITDPDEKAQVSLYVASLLKQIGQTASAEEYCDIAIESAKDGNIQKRAEQFKVSQ